MRALATWMVISVIGLTACGSTLKYATPSTARAPGADAKITADVKKDQNQTLLEVTIANLPPPGRVADGAQHFVAWHRVDSGATWTRVATLKYDDGSRKGELVGSVPATSFDFEISAEKDSAVASPSSDIVVAQHVN